MQKSKSLADRMNGYEQSASAPLPENLPIIIRVDGRCFHTVTQNMDEPFDQTFIDMMNHVALYLCKEIQNARIGYIQSDEISILMYQPQGAMAWFNNRIQKLVSVTASLATSAATQYVIESDMDTNGSDVPFDSRVFVLPPSEVVNYFIYRQQDWERNSLNMLASSHYDQKDLQNKSQQELHNMLYACDENWNDLPVPLKRGRCAILEGYTKSVSNEWYEGNVERQRWRIDNDIPIFTKDRGYIADTMDDDWRK